MFFFLLYDGFRKEFYYVTVFNNYDNMLLFFLYLFVALFVCMNEYFNAYDSFSFLISLFLPPQGTMLLDMRKMYEV